MLSDTTIYILFEISDKRKELQTLADLESDVFLALFISEFKSLSLALECKISVFEIIIDRHLICNKVLIYVDKGGSRLQYTLLAESFLFEKLYRLRTITRLVFPLTLLFSPNFDV